MQIDNSLVISIISLIISILTFLYNLQISRKKIKIKNKKIVPIYGDSDDNSSNFQIDCTIENKCKYPITITNVKFNRYKVFPIEISVGGGCGEKFCQAVESDMRTFSFPFDLNSFCAKKGVLLFSESSKIKLHRFNFIRIYTSRGITVKILYLSKKQLQQYSM